MVNSVESDVSSQVNRCSERIFRSQTFACDVKTSAVIRAGPNDGQPRREVDPIAEAQRFKRCEALIMVHGENPVELFVCPRSEEAVRRIRSHDKTPFGTEFSNGRCDDAFFFIAHQSVVTGVWVQSQYGNTRLWNSKISR